MKEECVQKHEKNATTKRKSRSPQSVPGFVLVWCSGQFEEGQFEKGLLMTNLQPKTSFDFMQRLAQLKWLN